MLEYKRGMKNLEFIEALIQGVPPKWTRQWALWGSKR